MSLEPLDRILIKEHFLGIQNLLVMDVENLEVVLKAHVLAGPPKNASPDIAGKRSGHHRIEHLSH